MNAIPATVISITGTTQPCSKLHSIMIMIDFDSALTPTSLTLLRHYMMNPITPAELLIHI